LVNWGRLWKKQVQRFRFSKGQYLVISEVVKWKRILWAQNQVEALLQEENLYTNSLFVVPNFQMYKTYTLPVTKQYPGYL